MLCNRVSVFEQILSSRVHLYVFQIVLKSCLMATKLLRVIMSPTLPQITSKLFWARSYSLICLATQLFEKETITDNNEYIRFLKFGLSIV